MSLSHFSLKFPWFPCLAGHQNPWRAFGNTISANFPTLPPHPPREPGSLSVLGQESLFPKPAPCDDALGVLGPSERNGPGSGIACSGREGHPPLTSSFPLCASPWLGSPLGSGSGLMASAQDGSGLVKTARGPGHSLPACVQMGNESGSPQT